MLSNFVGLIGFGNRITNNIHIVGAGGAPIVLQPRIGWNKKPQAGAGLAAWLEWRTHLTQLIGREAEKKRLIDWAQEPDALSIKVIEAPGGVGKTRLAAEGAQKLIDTQRWSGGFVGLADFEPAQSLAWQGHWLLVVDYPEHSPQQLAKLIRVAMGGMQANGQNKLRILLLCRTQSGVEDLIEDQGAKSYLSTKLSLSELTAADNLQLLRATNKTSKLSASI